MPEATMTDATVTILEIGVTEGGVVWKSIAVTLAWDQSSVSIIDPASLLWVEEHQFAIDSSFVIFNLLQ